jgi:hypothetical protein
MIVKQKFDLLRGIDNVLNVSESQLKSNLVENGPNTIFFVLDMMKNKVNHYTKDKIFKILSNEKVRDKYLHVVNLPNYPLPVSYNIPTKSIIINVSPFGIDDIESTKPGPYNLYALMVYSIVFRDLITKKIKIDEKFASSFSDFLVSIFIRLFGKQYGLLGSFAVQIPKMKFLTNVYVLDSFFGLKGLKAYKMAGVAAGYDYNNDIEMLNNFDFSNINEFIRSLSEFNVMPNMNRHIFAAKSLRFFGINVMPAFEDCARFVATIATSDIKGSNVVSTYLSKYNEREFGKILQISKMIFHKD